MTERRAKPRHLAPEYAAQFGDEEVAAAYRYRPPYSPESFAILDSLLGSRPRIVLELGAGTGDFTIGLAPLVDRLIAVEPAHLVAALAEARDTLTETHLEGAARFFSGWEFRHKKAHEARLLPRELRQRLLAHVLQSTDADKVQLARTALAE